MPRTIATTTIPNDVLDALMSGSPTADGQGWAMPPLDRKLYLATNQVLEACGGAWSRKAKAHLFTATAGARALVEAVVATGSYVDPKANDFYATPAKLADQLVARAVRGHARVLAGVSVRMLEPSAGKGAIVDAARRCLGNQVSLYAVELLPDNVAALHAKGGVAVWEDDFLKLRPGSEGIGYFDVVVMNPPFTGQQDIDHVGHAYSFLAPGGRLVSVMSAGTRFRTNEKAKDFREWAELNGGTFEDLPDGSFKESGTGVRTCVFTIQVSA